MTPLETLARRCGIALTINAGRGEQRVSAETLQTVLAALGVEADTEPRAVAVLAERERQAWQAVVPPVVVVHESPVVIDVTLPGATRTVSWLLTCEDGTQRTGEAAFANLELVGRDDGDCRPGRRKERRRLLLGALPLGYHQLSLEPQSGVCTVIVTPWRCFLPEIGAERGLWGLALQLYLLRSERNLGVGDFGDLAAVARAVTGHGCDVLGLNPLHAPFPDDMDLASPYSPASRLLLNPLNIDVAAALDVCPSPAAAALMADAGVQAEVRSSSAAATLDYRRVATLKERILRLVFADWRAADGEAAVNDFAAFRAMQGTSFERHCLYFALRAHMLAEGLGAGDWHSWPQPFQDSRAAVVARFARTHADEVTWVAWQQWLADRQLAAAAGAAEPMRVGLYRDLAVGANAAGAETWAERDLMLHALHIGAPPDAGSETGQEWGLPPPHPERLRASGYRSFVELLRANMRHAGALRIDHVMALERLYVIPKGAPAAAGTYLDYPFDDLMGITALESVRSRCLIIGEDLGLVPPGFRERMAQLQMLSYRVLRFEREGDRFLGPHEYPRLAVAVFGNHDLPTLRGWWEGAAPAERRALLDLLRAEGLLAGDAELPYDALFVAVHALLGRTNALMVLVQLDDALREILPVNAPGAHDYPSWRRRYLRTVDALGEEPLLAAVAEVLGARHRAAVNSVS